MEFLNQELVELKRRKEPKQILVYNLCEKLMAHKVPEDSIVSIVQKITGHRDRQQIVKMMEQVRDSLAEDYLGLQELSKR
jgi:hypothetical protein